MFSIVFSAISTFYDIATGIELQGPSVAMVGHHIFERFVAGWAFMMIVFWEDYKQVLIPGG